MFLARNAPAEVTRVAGESEKDHRRLEIVTFADDDFDY